MIRKVNAVLRGICAVHQQKQNSAEVDKKAEPDVSDSLQPKLEFGIRQKRAGHRYSGDDQVDQRKDQKLQKVFPPDRPHCAQTIDGKQQYENVCYKIDRYGYTRMHSLHPSLMINV